MHPTIARLAKAPEELSVADVAHVLAVHRTSVNLIIEQGRLEAISHNTKRGQRHWYRVTQEALLRYLVKSATGDKAVLMESIRAAFPHSRAALPVNAIPFTAFASVAKPKPRQQAAAPDHPDLFASA